MIPFLFNKSLGELSFVGSLGSGHAEVDEIAIRNEVSIMTFFKL